MAFFAAISSSIGKKLLLFGLRHIDILDKDPSDFVSVDVGKRTTLEVRDVGLHIKKLVALLHLKLPPELRLSKAHADLFRATVVFEFGVPQIIIELEGLQIRAAVSDGAEEVSPKDSPGKEIPCRTKAWARTGSPFRGRPSPDPENGSNSDTSSDFGSQQLPTVDGLAKSFIREEPAEEIQELEEALNSQAESLHESVSSSEESDSGETEGMGTGLGLPGVIKNLLNTALDRLQIIVTHINIHLDERVLSDADSPSTDHEDTAHSVNFEFERVSVDSLTSSEPQVDITTSSCHTPNIKSVSGKRRLRVENICGRLISNARNFASLSKVSRPASPVSTPSEASTGQESATGSSPRPAPSIAPQTLHQSFKTDVQNMDTNKVASAGNRSPSPSSYYVENRLTSSALTTDDDRYADVASDDGFDHGTPSSHDKGSQMRDSSIMYDDEGLLNYALENSLLNSRHGPLNAAQSSVNPLGTWGGDGVESNHEAGIESPSPRLQVRTTSQSSSTSISQSQPMFSSQSEADPDGSTDHLDTARHHIPNSSPSHDSSSQGDLSVEDLAESRLFTHDEAESMYMSALSAPPLDSSHQPQVPGGWDSASVSSQGADSDTARKCLPATMLTSRILRPGTEIEEGCETPRPGSRKSPRRGNSSSSYGKAESLPFKDVNPLNHKLSKVFFTVDQVNVWFPLDLGEASIEQEPSPSPVPEKAEVKFASTNDVGNSLFQDMPGSFSFYAQSTATRRRKSVSEGPEKPSRASTHRKRTSPPQTSDSAKSGPSSKISVEVGSIIGHVDLSTSRMLFQMAQKLIQIITGGSSQESKAPEVQKGGTMNSPPNFELSIKHIGFAWLEQLMIGSMVNNNYAQAFTALEANPADALLRLSIGSTRIASNKDESAVKIRKFTISSLNQDIISFQQSKSRSVPSDDGSHDRLKNDIEISFQQIPERRIKIITRSLIVLFDMLKLDEALGSYGGFSGVLELGNSISSNTSLQSLSSPPVRPRPRAVHFGDGTPQTPPPDPLPSTKVDFQFGNLYLTLEGRSCSLRVQTKPVRIAIRQRNVQIRLSEINLSGPYMDDGQDGAPLLIRVGDTRVIFLFAPEEDDLLRLISMITPSKDPYENDGDILVDTLLRQRRKGSVIRVDSAEVGVRVSNLDQLQAFEALGKEVSKLSKVTKYLPDDDRPGILTLATVHRFDGNINANERIGDVTVCCQEVQLAHVGLPPLFALQVGTIKATRGEEALLGEVTPLRQDDRLPMIMARMIGDEMEPVVKAKLFNLCIEYRVSTIMSALGIREDGTVEDIALGLASSVGTITGTTSPKPLSRQTSTASSTSGATGKPFHVDLLLRNCAIGLNPRKIPAKGLFVLNDTHFAGAVAKDEFSLVADIRKASIHVIDDIVRLDEPLEAPPSSYPLSSLGNRQLHELRESGYVGLGSISAAKASVKLAGDGKEHPQIVDVEFKNELFVMESCADSTQTLIAILNGLQPPSSPNSTDRYRTVVPLQEMMASFSGDAIPTDSPEPEDFMEDADRVGDEVPANLEFVGSFYSQGLPTEEELGDSMLGEDDLETLATSPTTRQRGEPALLESFQEQYEVSKGEEEFDFDNNYFADSDSDVKGTARKWDSKKNQYHLPNEFKTPDAPLKVRVRNMNIVWNLFDGYDWPRTRQIISQAVDDVEARAEERRNRSRDDDEPNVFIEEDFLFNSVWIGVPIKEEKGALARKINHDIDDTVSETGSYATSTATRSTGATIRPKSATKSRRRRLKLERSKHRKITFELTDVAVDVVVFPPGTGETQNSLNVRVRNFEIFDHLPSSTWKKFATSLQDPSEREMGRPMINLELLTVRPVEDLPASELVLRVTILPLRLHVDQDALDFITRFFEFKDDNIPDSGGNGEQPFLQRVEINTVKLKLDYKPKKVDYAGLRSGHTTEFMNFFILDGADITLRRAILYGITSADKLHQTLNDVWMPDVKRNQLPGVLAGLAPVRGIVNVTSGVSDLVVVPFREYKKDGRIVRSLQKGATQFARNTTSEIFRLGAKIAIGTQNVLEGAETFLNPQASSSRASRDNDWEELDPESADDEPRAVSNYANQPIGVMAGLRGAARHLEHDLLTARDAIIAIPGEVMESGSGVGMAKAIARRAPTVILRPALGATKAISHTLLGAGNALDKDSRRKIDDKYKSF
ncbi:hypothetical protein GQ43DRAFT_453199 [Delitschia confertaspora ATCC 74209]|uniref:Autophagy-related protein 2 n=1 Tax=Delitschia confertaspora ATCC 74209 TaxID=1513339 RepID=A0A9P4JXH2_9PLEO|nr:hypothetical protein GQ43DRAFT_453199 [Delitschia confertaspora ATCC 74209]